MEYIFDLLLDKVFAKDIDVGMNADLDYSIKTGKGKGRFKIHPKTGQVFTSKAFAPGQTFDIMVWYTWRLPVPLLVS